MTKTSDSSIRVFEFHVYKGDADGNVVTKPEINEICFDETAQARRYAGQLAKRFNGPVDLAKGGEEAWEDRYITTAAPSAYHTSGYRFERLI
jgi:hypothetical protein